MTNIGECPTFGGCKRTVEVYLIDFTGDLYGRAIKVDITGRLRGEKRFGSAEELKKQMAEDLKRGKALLSTGSRDQEY